MRLAQAAILCGLVSACLARPAAALPPLPNPFAGLPSPRQVIAGLMECDMPGMADCNSMFVFPPVLRGELRARPLFIGLSGTVENTITGQQLDLVDDLGYVNQGILTEWMGRAQFGRFSARVHFDMYMRTFRGTRSRLDWPDFHAGFDFDLISRPAMRVGLNMDFYPERPDFFLNASPIGTVRAAFPKPSTAGFHVVLMPKTLGSLSGMLETRGRRSLRTGTRLDELEFAMGLTTPETVLGTVALRAGWRYSHIFLGTDSYDINIDWSAYFGELVYYY
jgi:hypothetical protein